MRTGVLHYGDNLDILRETIPDGEVDLVYMDPPFATNRLLTSLSSQCPWDGAPGHNSASVDGCVPGYAYWDAWRYMAGS